MKKHILHIDTRNKEEVLDVTQQVQKVVSQHLKGDGAVLVFCPHTTAGICINECADPDVKTDFLLTLKELITFEHKFRHAEGNSKGHVGSIFTGHSHWIAVEGGKLDFGTWQSLWFCEFDGPRKRQLWVNCYSMPS